MLFHRNNEPRCPRTQLQRGRRRLTTTIRSRASSRLEELLQGMVTVMMTGPVQGSPSCVVSMRKSPSSSGNPCGPA